MTRDQRRRRILQLIGEHCVPSQHELQRLLDREGIEVTQATLSRDLRDMGVVKGPEGYIPPGMGAAGEQRGERELERVFRHELLEVQSGGTTIVCKTRPGHANALAVEIDRCRLPDVLGSIAGDDTVFIAARSTAHTRSLLRQIRTWAGLN